MPHLRRVTRHRFPRLGKMRRRRCHLLSRRCGAVADGTSCGAFWGHVWDLIFFDAHHFSSSIIRRLAWILFTIGIISTDYAMITTYIYAEFPYNLLVDALLQCSCLQQKCHKYPTTSAHKLQSTGFISSLQTTMTPRQCNIKNNLRGTSISNQS